MKSLLISPHDDDSALFASFICLREKPLVCVVTDSYIQPARGEVGCSADERARETKSACEVLGVPVVRLHIPDLVSDEESIVKALSGFGGFDMVYAPALQGGNKDHDATHYAAAKSFKNIRYYTTYTKQELWTKGIEELIPTEEELNLKYKALQHYRSQWNLPATRPHFEAVMGKSEWLV